MSDPITEGAPAQGFIRRKLSAWHGSVIAPLVSSRNPPWFYARGVGIGLLVGFGAPVGSQMICLGLLRMAIRFNSVIAFIFTWVTNPISFVPMYYGYYRIGSYLLGKQSVMSEDAFRNLMRPLTDGGYFWESFQAFAALGWDFLGRWLLAGLVIAPISGIIGYFLAYRFQWMRCRRKAKKLGISYDLLLKDLEDKMVEEGE